jgi:hypothetical protein
MSTDQPYNSIGQILAAGADQYAAVKLARGLSETEIIPLLRDRFRPDPASDLGQVMAIAIAGRYAAQRLNELGPGANFADVDIPINPYLFGEDTGGLRYRAIAEGTVAESGKIFQTRLDIPDIIDWGEVYEAASTEMQDIVTEYPEAARVQPGNTPNIENVDFLYIVGAF